MPVSKPTTAGPQGEALSPERLAELVDIPLYPGASAPSGKSKAPLKDASGGTRYELIQVTADPVAKVAAFYKEKLALDTLVSGNSGTAMGKSPKGNYLILTLSRTGDETTIKANAIAPPK
jgi:hypothetical protein